VPIGNGDQAQERLAAESAQHRRQAAGRPVIDAARLLADLTRLRADLEDDLRERCADDPELDAFLQGEHRRAITRERTSETYTAWREEHLTQVAVAWILGCVFVRFLEDNALVDPPLLSGPGERRKRALDEHNLYFRAHPTDSDREYLLHVFRTVASLPVAGQLFDEAHNPIWSLEQPDREFRAPSGDAATRLLGLWQRIDPDSGTLAHDFADPVWDTRFLGDLYQDLSESARKRYALLQTPEFVEEFILDRTLDPAVEEFGFREVRLIDPACGSGHFLLGAFRRLDALWERHEPGTNPRERASRVLEQVAGVDLNPFAAAIARFRLCIAALWAAGVQRLADAPAFELHVAAGDSLLHGPRPGLAGARQEYLDPTQNPLAHVYQTEDAEALRAILGLRYHVVVGNPPYITPKDKALNRGYRLRFGSCHREYSLAVPFTERFFDLAHAPALGAKVPAGFVGMVTANSFMKREFGRKLIEKFIPRYDLTAIVDTSGAYFPGHGTPTVILFGRHRQPVSNVVRTVMGIHGEPSIPANPANGLVWSAIYSQVDRLGSHSEFVSVSDLPRDRFHEHPWNLGGGGAAELLEKIQSDGTDGTIPLKDFVEGIGTTAITGEDYLFMFPDRSSVGRLRIESTIPLLTGDRIRDWSHEAPNVAIWIYDSRHQLKPIECFAEASKLLWLFRVVLARRKRFGTPMLELGLTWYEWRELYAEKLKTPLSIAFAFVGTHNHFMLDRGGKVFKQSAPVIKLPARTGENLHIELLGLLNSSTGCFWMKQVFHNKGGGGIGGGLATEQWEQFCEFDQTKIRKFPVPYTRPFEIPYQLDCLARERSQVLPCALILRGTPSVASLQAARTRVQEIRERMISLQEELDWRCYRLYGLTKDDICLPRGDVPASRLGERAFEIVLARRIAAGEVETKWFERHGSTPITEIPTRWPAEYRELIRRRIEAIEKNSSIALIEQPEYKRRWNDEPWEAQQERALRSWLLDHLEAPSLWSEPRLTSAAALADRMREDQEFLQVAELYTGRPDFDVARLVAGLVEEQSVPLLPVLRYKPSGLRKRAEWERTWDLQRREDAIDARIKLSESNPEHLTPEAAAALKEKEIGAIPVPPRYTSTDFRKGTWWRLRGKLDVPKERFFSLPFCEREADPSLVIGWAGWNTLEQSRAVAAYFTQMREQEGWTAERLTPLLAALLELLPWVRQYHNAPDPEFDTGMGDYFEGFIDEEARALSLTRDAVRAWTPPAGPGRRGARRRSSAAGM